MKRELDLRKVTISDLSHFLIVTILYPIVTLLLIQKSHLRLNLFPSFLPRLDKMRREKRALMQNRAVRTVNWKEISKNASAADPEVQDQPETDKVQSGASGRAVGLG